MALRPWQIEKIALALNVLKLQSPPGQDRTPPSSHCLPLSARTLCLLQNNGRIARQEVDHVHFHVIPRPAEGDAEGVVVGWPAQKPSMDELKKDFDEAVEFFRAANDKRLYDIHRHDEHEVMVHNSSDCLSMRV